MPTTPNLSSPRGGLEPGRVRAVRLDLAGRVVADAGAAEPRPRLHADHDAPGIRTKDRRVAGDPRNGHAGRTGARGLLQGRFVPAGQTTAGRRDHVLERLEDDVAAGVTSGGAEATPWRRAAAPASV